MSRARRILQYLVAHPGSGLVAIADAVEPGNRAARRGIAAQIHQLASDGRIARSGAHRKTVYTATANALVDRRRVANAKSAHKRRGPRKATSASDSKPAVPPKAPAGKARTPLDTQLRRRSAHRPTGDVETVAEFTARGGRIERLPHGAVSQPLQFIGHRALNEATWRDRPDAPHADY